MKIIHIGNMANDSFSIIEGLKAIGYEEEVRLLIADTGFAMAYPQWEYGDLEGIDPYDADFDKINEKYPLPDWVDIWHYRPHSFVSNLLDLHKMTRGYDIRQIHSPFPIYLQFNKPFNKQRDIIHEAGWGRQLFSGHGGDWRTTHLSTVSKLGRLAYKKATAIVMTNPDMYSFMSPFLKRKNGMRKDIFIPFAINTDRYKPIYVEKKHDLLFFMPSRFNIRVKGNDKVLKAFKRFVEKGNRAILRIVDWGWSEDVKWGVDYLRKYELSKYIDWIKPCCKNKLVMMYNEADLILDQFNIGSGGTTLPEAMACEKPVAIYLNKWNRLCFGEMQPILNARTETDILNVMEFSINKTYRNYVGKRAREFVMRNYNYKVVAKLYADFYSTVSWGYLDD